MPYFSEKGVSYTWGNKVNYPRGRRGSGIKSPSGGGWAALSSGVGAKTVWEAEVRGIWRVNREHVTSSFSFFH